MTDITVIILVGQEKIHMQRCMEKLAGLAARQVFVVESQEDDGGHQIALDTAAKLDWRVQDGDQSSAVHLQPSPTLSLAPHSSTTFSLVFHAWPGTQSEQFNWALDNMLIQTKWVLRLDADEYLCPELIEEIKSKLEKLPDDVTGVAFNLRRVFMGRVIRHGMPRIRMIRLFRFGKGRCEERMMDEHIKLIEGKSVEFMGEFADDNLNNLSWWTQKHIGYAIREAADLLDIEFNLFAKSEQGTLGEQAAMKRQKKMRYAKLPLFWRAAFYFVLRYIVKGGFLDGKEGFLWHFLQGWWYRTLVDAKIVEIKKSAATRGGGNAENILLVLKEEYGIKIQ